MFTLGSLSMPGIKVTSKSLTLLMLFTILALSPGYAVAKKNQKAVEFSGVMRAIDGDTLVFKGQRLRIFGISAPEMNEPRGPVSLAAMDDIVNGKKLKCVQRDIDRYQRPVVRCLLSGKDIAEIMVRNGWAFAYRYFTDIYDEAEREARKKGNGFWQRSNTKTTAQSTTSQSIGPGWIAFLSALFGVLCGLLINRFIRPRNRK